MPLNPLDQAIYELDRQAEIDIYIRGELLVSGLSSVPDIPNPLGVEVAFDIEQMPPTATLTVADIAMHHVKIERGDAVEINAGFNGNLERVFTGHVKRRRHGVSHDTIDCVGRTGVLTRPFRSPDDPKSWTSQTAVFAINDILDDLTPPFTPAEIDAILMDDGITNFTIGTVVPARMEAMPPSDMIRKIADVYGHRAYEQKSGTLRIRDLLEAPAPSGYRVYGTQGTDRLALTTISHDDANIDSNLVFGDAAATERRSQGFTPTADGTATRVTLWLRKIGAPADKVGLSIETDDGAGAPSGTSLGGGDVIAGSILQVGVYTQIDVTVTTETRLVSGTVYHLVVRRSSANDAVNHYEVGADSHIGISYDTNPDAWAVPEDPWVGGAVGERDISIYITDDAAVDYGNTGIGAYTFGVAAQQQDARRVTLPAGTYTDIAAYGVVDILTRDVRFALYDDNAGAPGNLLAYTASFAVNTTPQWWSAGIAFDDVGGGIADIALGAGDYWITIFSRGGGGFTFTWYFDEVGYAGGIANVYDSGAGTWGAGGGDLAFEVDHYAFPALRLLNISDDEDEDQVKKQVLVQGAVVPSTTPASGDDPGGDETQTQITAERHTDSNDLVAGDYRLYSTRWSNHLVETAVVADEVAARLVNKYHRILQSIEIEIPFDPRIDLGSTIEIRDKGTSPDYAGEVTGKNGNWWIRGYRHSLTPEGAVTYVSLFGGDQGGTTSEASPQADFYWTIERELVGAAIQAIVTFHDVSTDADGWIVNYRWVDDYLGGANDVQGAGEDFRVVTFVYNPATDASVNMTLTVTDNDGNTHSVTRAVDVSTDNDEVYAPVVACAGGNTCMATFDGGLSWADIATPAGVAKKCEVTFTNDLDDPPVIFFGTDGGRIYRSVDYNVTLVLVADTPLTNGSEITGIAADKRIRERIWACCLDGRILRSDDYGATWALYVHLGIYWPHRHDVTLPVSGNSDQNVDPTPIHGITVSEPWINRIWVWGGRGTDPESWFHTHCLADDPIHWLSEIADTAHEDTEEGSVATSTGTAADTVMDAVVSHRTSGDLGLCFAGRNPVFIYAPPRYYPAAGAEWMDIGGTPAADGVSVEGNNNRLRLFGMVMDNTNFYRSQEGYPIWEELVGVLPGTGANRPHDLLQVSAWKDIYLVATDEGIGKSTDYGENWNFFRGAGGGLIVAWPGGAIGWDVAIEYRRPRRFDVMAIVHDPIGTTENALAIRQGQGTWVDQGPLPTAHSDRPHRLWHFPQIDDQTLFYVRYTSGVLGHNEALYRSTNLGGVWANVLARCGTIARGSDGRMWASWESHPGGHAAAVLFPHVIVYSDDDGANWIEAHEDTRNAAGNYISYFNIAVDPNNHKRVMAAGHLIANNIRILVTEDAHLGAGATWSEVTPVGMGGYEGIAPRYHQPLLIAGENGRWIIGKQLNAVNTLQIFVSDNNGATWTQKHTIGIAGNTHGFSDAFRMGNILFFGGGMIGAAADRAGLISFNNGEDWEALTADAGGHQGFVYDPRFDMLIANVNSASELKFMQPPREDQSWVEGMAVGLDTAMGYAAAMVENALAVQGTT